MAKRTTITISSKIYSRLKRIKRILTIQRGDFVSWDEVMNYLIRLHEREMRNAQKEKGKGKKDTLIGGIYGI